MMKNIKYMTLADLRNADPVKFDQTIKKCLFEAAASLPKETLIAAFTPDWSYKYHLKAA